MSAYIDSPASGVYGRYIESIGGLLSGNYGKYVENNNGISGSLSPGALALLFANPFFVIQTDLGLTYGSTLLATGTTPPVITLTGSLSTVPVPITISCTLLGARGTWAGTYSFDGGATTTAFTSAATIALTGLGAGLTLNIATGTAATNNVWKATCAGLADQSTNGFNFTQTTSSQQPVITVGYSGKPGLLFDSTRNSCIVSSFSAPAPGTTSYTIYAIFKPFTSGGQQNFCGAGGVGAGTIYDHNGTLTSISEYNGTAGNTSSLTSVQSRVFADFTNSTSDRIKCGSNSIVTGTSSGATNASAFTIGAANNTGVFSSNFELLTFIIAPLISGTLITTLDGVCGSFYPGAGVLV